MHQDRPLKKIQDDKHPSRGRNLTRFHARLRSETYFVYVQQWLRSTEKAA